jgi:hypothetical protein
MRTKLFKKINLPLLGRGLGGGLLLLLFAAGCSKDEEPEPVLDIDKTAIDVAYTTGTYIIAVTSNVAWTAIVNAAATWCTVSPTTGTGNGSVTVNIAANAAVVTRSATVTLAAGTLTREVGVVQATTAFTISEDDNAPFHAASNKVWVFGSSTLMWSDAIYCPECNKETFEESDIDPQCRSYTEDGKIWYYYNWPYVDENKDELCPNPWRVPTYGDFRTLSAAPATLVNAWGYTGCEYRGAVVDLDSGTLWSSTGTEHPGGALNFVYDDSSSGIGTGNMFSGRPVRCVRDN